MRITSKGQVTIPIAIREKAGLMPNTEVEFAYENGEVLIRRPRRVKRNGKPTRGERIVAHLRAHPGDVQMTTDEIMKLMRGE
jgi:AbrB family looped-hinge helix DNA binding protein